MAYIGNSPDLNESVDTAQLKSPLTGDLGLGADADGTDRILTFGHSTLKSVIGIDDSADIFAINTDDAFEAANDLEIDASGNVTISNGTLTINADDTGADVRFYSATTNEGLLYDASEDELGLLLTTKLKFHDIGGGEEIYASGDGALVMNSGTSLTVTTPDMTLTSATASKPILHITNTHDLTTSGELRFNKDSTGDDNDVMGLISFYGTDSSDNTHERLAYMDAIVTDSAHASEAASMRFYVAENDATLTQGLAIAGQADADGEIDVTIGAGAASTCTVAGDLTVTGIGGGITEADQWRLDTSFDGDLTPIHVNLERNDTNFDKIGTGMSESSGIFSFPSTGIWQVTWHNQQLSTAATAIMWSNIRCTVNDSDYANCATMASSVSQGGPAYQGSANTLIFDVTNVSTHKVQFGIGVDGSNQTTRGNSGTNMNTFTFIRLGNT